MLPPALADLLAAHRAIGAEARDLAALATGGGRLCAHRTRALARVLIALQRAEEVAVLPALAAVDPGFDPAALAADHDEVAAAAADLHLAVRRGDEVPRAAVRLARLVALHHADEQRALVPRWALLTPCADAAVARALRRSLGAPGRLRLARLERRTR